MVWQLRGIPIAQKKLIHGPAHGNFQLKNAIFPGNHPQNRPSSAAAFHELHTKALVACGPSGSLAGRMVTVFEGWLEGAAFVASCGAFRAGDLKTPMDFRLPATSAK